MVNTNITIPLHPRIGHIRILGIRLELAYNGGSCGGIPLKIDQYNLHLKRLPCISLTCSYFQSNNSNIK